MPPHCHVSLGHCQGILSFSWEAKERKQEPLVMSPLQMGAEIRFADATSIAQSLGRLFTASVPTTVLAIALSEQYEQYQQHENMLHLKPLESKTASYSCAAQNSLERCLTYQTALKPERLFQQ